MAEVELIELPGNGQRTSKPELGVYDEQGGWRHAQAERSPNQAWEWACSDGDTLGPDDATSN